MTLSSRFKPISEQVIVITGASSGIGLATARMAAEGGAKVVLSSRNAEDLQEICAVLNAKGFQTTPVAADVSKPEDLERLRDVAIAAYGGIDTWVNNAGASIFGRLLDTKLEDERELFETNYWGIRNGSHVGIEAMRENGGVLINLGSEVSARAVPLQGTYAATKHAVKAFTDALRMELEHDRIPVAVTLIRPTAIDTPLPLHAKNELREGEPSLPGMAYSPDLVAEAILKCAVEPQRDVFVGGSSRFLAILEAVAPRFADLLMERLLFSQQRQGVKIPHEKRHEALWTAATVEGKVRGGHRSRVRHQSVYTFLALRPKLTLLGAMGAGAGLAALYLARTQRRPRPSMAEQSRAGW